MWGKCRKYKSLFIKTTSLLKSTFVGEPRRLSYWKRFAPRKFNWIQCQSSLESHDEHPTSNQQLEQFIFSIDFFGKNVFHFRMLCLQKQLKIKKLIFIFSKNYLNCFRMCGKK